METKDILHMTKGDGEFSYACNSITHGLFTNIIKPVLERTIKSLLQDENMRSFKTLNVADMGCGVGPTPLALISTVVESVDKIWRELKKSDFEVPKIQIYMSDFPSNDFNLLFKDVMKLKEGLRQNGLPLCFFMGVPGSFYGRLFPCNSLHLVHSCYAFHWLSKVPRGLCNEEGKHMNKGKIVASDTSIPQILEAYSTQFQYDFSSFLDCRSHEVAPNGLMVLSSIGRLSAKQLEPRIMKFLFQALDCLVSKGMITEEKLDCFNLPMYTPCKEEIQDIVSKEGSFAIENLEVVLSDDGKAEKDARFRAKSLAKLTRSITENLISNHFGMQIWNELYHVLYQITLEHFELDPETSNFFSIVISLRRKMD